MVGNLIPYYFILFYLTPVKYYPLIGIFSPIWYLIFQLVSYRSCVTLIRFLLISHFMCWCVLESIICWFDFSSIMCWFGFWYNLDNLLCHTLVCSPLGVFVQIVSHLVLKRLCMYILQHIYYMACLSFLIQYIEYSTESQIS